MDSPRPLWPTARRYWPFPPQPSPSTRPRAFGCRMCYGRTSKATSCLVDEPFEDQLLLHGLRQRCTVRDASFCLPQTGLQRLALIRLPQQESIQQPTIAQDEPEAWHTLPQVRLHSPLRHQAIHIMRCMVPCIMTLVSFRGGSLFFASI